MAIDITPTGMWSQPEPQGPTGLAGFFQQPDIGSEIGERLGLVGEILGRLGSGQGLAGISGQIGAVNERSTKRKTRRQMLQMANRMADKLEGSNPDLAMMIRANPEYGLELAGKMAMAPIEFENEMKLSRAKGADEYKRAIDLATKKSQLEAINADLEAKRRMRMILPGYGDDAGATSPGDTSALDSGAIPQTAISGPAVASQDTAQPIPNPLELGGGNLDPAQAAVAQGDLGGVPIEQGDAGDWEDPNPIGADGVDYSIGLADIPQDRQFQLYLRKRYKDPDITITEASRVMNAVIEGKSLDEAVGAMAKRQTERDAPKQRVAALEEAAGFAGPQGPYQPNDPKQAQAPYDAILDQAGIPIADKSPEVRKQLAVALKAEMAAGEDNYGTMLKQIATAGAGSEGEIVIKRPDGSEIRIAGDAGKAATEGQAKANIYSKTATESNAVLNSPEAVGALTSLTSLAQDIPIVGNMMTTDATSRAKTAARDFVESIVRIKSGATIQLHEYELAEKVFIPVPGDENKPRTVAYKELLRKKVLQGIDESKSPAQQAKDMAKAIQDATEELNEAKAKGVLIEQDTAVIPPMAPWAVKAGITEEVWAAQGPDVWFATDEEEPKP